VNQIPITGHAAKKKCKLRELLKLAYWKLTTVSDLIYTHSQIQAKFEMHATCNCTSREISRGKMF